MKTRLLLIGTMMLALFTISYAQQGVAINTTGAAPDPTAILDVSSTTKGLLIPRLTDLQMYGITNPSKGLFVYNTDCRCFYYYDLGWEKIVNSTANYQIRDEDGDSYMTFRYTSGDDDTLRIFFENEEKYRISSQAIEPVNNNQSVFFGEGAGGNNPSFGNVFIGYQTGYNSTGGIFNTGAGYQVLNKNTSGTANTAFGGMALSGNTTGTRNTAMGWGSQQYGKTGTYNTSAGYESLMYSKGGFNIAIGFAAMYYDSTGNNNVAIGSYALRNSGSSFNNTAVGFATLY